MKFGGTSVGDPQKLKDVATRIVELDRGRLLDYPGNFSAYEARKAEQLAVEAVENRKFDKLLAQEEAWIRKDASVLFPWHEDDWPSGDEIVIVEVGGEDCEDQRARLRFLAEEIRREDRSGSLFPHGGKRISAGSSSYSPPG